MTLTSNLSEATLHVLDGSAPATFLGVTLNLIPQATTVIVFLWVLVRLYETDTVQCWVHKRKCHKED
jgi:hypothetical protein